MTTFTTIAFILSCFMVSAILIKLGYLIYEAIVLGRRDYDGREWFDDQIDINEDDIRCMPTDIEIIDREAAYEQS